MDAIVLAGGYATRLWPVTKHRPKMFLPVGDDVVIDHILRELEEDDRVEDVYISTNERFADDFREHIAASPFDKPVLSVEDTSGESEKFGVVGALAQLIDREGVEDDTLVIAGDNLISFAISDYIDFSLEKGTPTLAAYDVGSYEKAKSYGLVELDGDRIVDFQEKPDDPKSTLVSIGCYTFPADTLGLLSEYLEDGNNPDEPGWFIQWLYQNQPVHAFSFDGAWYDIGTPASYLETVAWELDGDSIVADSATVENSTVGENVHVMDGVELVDTEIDNSVVFPEATIKGCDVDDSIVDTGAHLAHLTVADAMIGAHTSFSGSD